MNLAAHCTECCDCPVPEFRYQAREITWSKCGPFNYDDDKYYLFFQSPCTGGESTTAFIDPNTCEDHGGTYDCEDGCTLWSGPGTGTTNSGFTTMRTKWGVDTPTNVTGPQAYSDAEILALGFDPPSSIPGYTCPQYYYECEGKVTRDDIIVDKCTLPYEGDGCDKFTGVTSPLYNCPKPGGCEAVEFCDHCTKYTDEGPLSCYYEGYWYGLYYTEDDPPAVAGIYRSLKRIFTETWTKTGEVFDGEGVSYPVGTTVLDEVAQYYLPNGSEDGGPIYDTHTYPDQAPGGGLCADSMFGNTTFTGERGLGNTLTNLYCDEFTLEMVFDGAVYNLPAWPGDGSFDGSPYGAGTHVGTVIVSDPSVYLQEVRYQIGFPVPRVRHGKNYRVTWVERRVPTGGASLTAVQVISQDAVGPIVSVYCPTSLPEENAYLVPVMSSTGRITSINIVNPGLGYPAGSYLVVHLPYSGTGIAHDTGWVATFDANGQITAVTGGDTAKDWRATMEIHDYSTSFTWTMTPSGGIASVTVVAGGSGLDIEPTMRFTSTSGDYRYLPGLSLVYGTETAKCARWDGTVPGDYEELDSDTWPILIPDYADSWTFPLYAPGGVGETTRVAKVRVLCDDSACP